MLARLEKTVFILKGQRGFDVSLSGFIKEAWHIVEPGSAYQHGWHIDAICEHLEAVTKGQIRNLLINIPPRHAKSLIVCVFWPVWEWITSPHMKWVFTSYSREFSYRDSLKCRRLIQSRWFQERYGSCFQLSKDQRTKGRFDNDRSGFRFATSVTAGATGEGGDRIIVDDAHSTSEAESDVIRANTLIWWDEVMGSRDNNPKTCARVAIGQRQHFADLYGHLINKGNYIHLCLPAEYEGNKSKTILGFEDPREEQGQLLWPDRMGEREIQETKVKMGTYAYTGQYQQRPTPREGGLIKKSWFKYYKLNRDNFGNIILKDFKSIYQSWDTAFKDGEQNDWSVCLTWGIKEDGFYLLGRWKEKVLFPELESNAIILGNMYKPNQILIEDKASGQSLVQSMRKRTNLPIKPVQVDRDKIARVNASSPYFEAGKIFLPDGETWVPDYVEELTTFPAAKHDDQVDSTTLFIMQIALNRELRQNPQNISFIGR